jgi:NitT/TauT family transport system permease protein
MATALLERPLAAPLDAAAVGRPRRGRGVVAAIGVPLLLILGTLVVWELAKVVTGSDDRTMPHVWSIAQQLWTRTSQDELYVTFLVRNMFATFKASATGLVFGAALGLLSGVLIARSRWFGAGVLPLTVAAQTVPIVAVAPALVLWLGTGWTTKASIAAYLTFFPVTVATAKGIQSVPADSLDLMKTYGASSRTLLTKVQLPAALPLILVGLETAAAFSVVGAIVGELPFGSKEGLGVVILTSWQFYSLKPEALYCAALAACLLGGLMVIGVRLLGRTLPAGRNEGTVV